MAIVKACQDLLAHFEEYEDEFAIPAIQGGAGTSTNMNVNEVVANRAIELLGDQKGDYQQTPTMTSTNHSQPMIPTQPRAI